MYKFDGHIVLHHDLFSGGGVVHVLTNPYMSIALKYNILATYFKEFKLLEGLQGD